MRGGWEEGGVESEMRGRGGGGVREQGCSLLSVMIPPPPTGMQQLLWSGGMVSLSMALSQH